MRMLRINLLLALLVLAAPVSAMPMKYNFNGACSFNCGILGLTTGDLVSGFLEAPDTSVFDGILSAGDLSGFGFDFGSISIVPTSHTAAGFFYVDGSSPTLVGGGMSFQALFTGASTLQIGDFGAWTARVGIRTAGGPGVYEVPEPGTLLLMGLGLVIGGLFSRRKLAARRAPHA